MHPIASAATPLVDNTAWIACWQARHQSAGSCSAQAARGDVNGA